MEPDAAERALPAFSLAERDRRWGQVRELMARDGIDALVAPPNTGGNERNQADARYLTQYGMNGEQIGCVFPLNGSVIGFGGPSSRLVTGWIDDVRNPRRTFNEAIVDALKELGVEHGVIGVCGLQPSKYNLMRVPDGVVGANLLDLMRQTFPAARIVSATNVTGEARMTKSAEEIAFLERSTAIAEAGLDALLETARPGVRENSCYAAMIKAEIEQGASLPFKLSWESGPAGHLYERLTHATRRVLRDGDLIINEIEGNWGGYMAQIDTSIYLGHTPADCQDAWKVATDSFERTVATMRPGLTFGELLETCAATPVVGGWGARLILHGRGLGDEGPLITFPPYDPEVTARPLQEGNTFIIKPQVRREREGSMAIFGDTVTVTATGARRLGKRPTDFATYHIVA
ncbi:MAG TPA: M24 family metallopeptidase [Chloroflexota bacterium]|nr:M24 family metallopeptidase [Chloroflexota bacterium]